jgi:hypothetical protein
MEEEGIHFRFADAQAKVVYDLTASQRAELAILAGRSRFRSAPPELETDDVFDGRNATAMAVSTWRMARSRAILTAKGMWAWNGFSNDDAWSDVRLDEGRSPAAGRVDATVDLGRGMTLEAGAQAERTAQWRLRQRYIRPIYRVVNDYDRPGTRGGDVFARAMVGGTGDAGARCAGGSLERDRRDDGVAVDPGGVARCRSDRSSRRRRRLSAVSRSSSTRSARCAPDGAGPRARTSTTWASSGGSVRRCACR